MEIAPSLITLTELGPTNIVTAADWDAKGLEDILPVMAAEKIVNLKWLGQFCAVQSGSYVGQARSAQCAVTIRPRFPKFFKAIKDFLPEAASRAAELQSLAFREDLEKSKLHPAQRFLIRLCQCLDEGIPFKYGTETVTTEFPRGAIDMNATIRGPASRGVAHQAICRQYTRQPLPEYCTVINTAAELAKSWFLEKSASTELLHLDTWLPVFTPGPSSESQAALELGDSLLSNPFAPAASELLAAALALLRADTALTPIQHRSRNLRFDFLKTDYLWELAVFQVFAELPQWQALFHPLRTSPAALLTDGGPEIDPDVLLTAKAPETAVVLDAKYSVAHSATATDVYQILAYTDRLSAAHGALIYLAETENWLRKIGTTPAGGTLWEAGVAKEDPVRGLRDLARNFQKAWSSDARAV